MATFRLGDASGPQTAPTHASLNTGRLASWLNRGAMVREQEQVLSDAVQRTGRALPMTKPGDAIAARGVPILGVMSGTILGTQPEHEAVKNSSRAFNLQERTRLPRAIRTASAPSTILVDELDEADYDHEAEAA